MKSTKSNKRRPVNHKYEATPTNDSYIGYIGGVGPFYTSVLTESSLETSIEPSVRFKNDPVTSSIEFLPHQSSNRSRANILQASAWVYLAIISLFASCCLVYVAFLSNGWGVVERGSPLNVVTWRFGLWMSCRDDGVCLGLKWPAFYAASRTFFVLTLFSNSMSLAWLIGHNIERLLKFDLCTMGTLAALCFFSSLASLLTVVSFGVYWRDYMLQTFDHIRYININYAFYVAVATVPLSSLAGVFLLVDLKGSWKEKEMMRQLNSR